MAHATNNPHHGITLAIPWAIQSTLWQAISHAECARMIAAKWPTTHAHRVGWPVPIIPSARNNWRSNAAYHIDAQATFHWMYNEDRRAWAGSHHLALQCIYQQFELSLSRFKDVFAISLTCREFHQACCQWVPSHPPTPTALPQMADPAQRPVHALPSPLPSTWPLQFCALRNAVEPHGWAHCLANMPEPMELCPRARMLTQLIAEPYFAEGSQRKPWFYTSSHGTTMEFHVLVRVTHRVFSLGRHHNVYEWKLKNCSSQLKECNDLAVYELWYRSSQPVVRLFKHQDMHQLPRPHQLW